MTITITTASLISEMRQKSHFEVQNIKESQLRDNVRAGLEKMEELGRDVCVADAQLRTLLNRYLQTTLSESVSVGITVPETLSYALNFSERRAANKSAEIPQLMRDYLVNAALSKYYATVSATDLASSRGNQAAALGAEIIRTIYTKTPPAL